MTSETTLTETEAAAKADIFEILSHAPGEVRGVQEALREGRIDGTGYKGRCACLVGTIANLQGVHYENVPGILINQYRPAEQWFADFIWYGDTPENDKWAKMLDGWLTEWLTTYGEANNDG